MAKVLVSFKWDEDKLSELRIILRGIDYNCKPLPEAGNGHVAQASPPVVGFTAAAAPKPTRPRRDPDEEAAAYALSPGGKALLQYLHQHKGKATERELEAAFLATPKTGGKSYARTSFFSYVSMLRNAGYLAQNATSGMFTFGPKVADKLANRE